MRTITSDEINFLLYRYLQESGFKHSAFTFGYESNIHKSNIGFGSDIQPGALIAFIQKGIQYLEIEAKLRNKENGETGDLKYSSPFELLFPQAKQKIAKSSARRDDRTRHTVKRSSSSIGATASSSKDHDKSTSSSQNHHNSSHHPAAASHDQQSSANAEAMDIDHHSSSNSTSSTTASSSLSTLTPSSTSTTAAPTTTTTTTTTLANNTASSTSSNPSTGAPFQGGDGPVMIPDTKVTVLRGHSHEVFICAWNPSSPNILASGSGDSTARIWTLPPGSCGEQATALASSTPIVLKHSSDIQGSSKDVTTLDWSGDGSMLATGSYDGKARIWTNEGKLISTLDKHKGPIFSLKWNKRGDYLLSGSVDNTAIIWDVKTGDVKQQFKNHSAPTLDVDWRTDTSFATCSTDKMIYVCRLGEQKPLRVFQGHEDEVNAIRWDPSGSLLASCSDDFTAKIWSMKSDRCIYDFKEHTKEIYTIKWSPTGPGTNYPNKDLVLASASFDASIKIWDINVGKCLYSLTKHTDPVYSVSFSPDGEFLASGSFDRCLHIWSVKDGKLVKTYQGNGSIFEVCWNSAGDKVAACFSNSVTEDFSVCVIDFKM